MRGLSHWQKQHEQHELAWHAPRPGYESAIVGMTKAWLAYAEAHTDACGSTLESDCYLGPEWETIGHSIRALLNGDTGRLDCGTVDQLIYQTLQHHGFSGDL